MIVSQSYIKNIPCYNGTWIGRSHLRINGWVHLTAVQLDPNELILLEERMTLSYLPDNVANQECREDPSYADTTFDHVAEAKVDVQGIG